MTLAQLLPQAKMLLVTTPQPAAQKVAHRAAEMATKFDLEILGVVENMSGFTTPDGTRHTIFGEGGGQLLADEIGVPLLGKVPLQEELRVQADEGVPLVAEDPDAPAAQALLPPRARHRRRDAAGAAGRADAGDGRRARLRRQRAAGYSVGSVSAQRRQRTRPRCRVLPSSLTKRKRARPRRRSSRSAPDSSSSSHTSRGSFSLLE